MKVNDILLCVGNYFLGMCRKTNKDQQPGLTLQRYSALINSGSEFQVCFGAVHYLKICEQR